MKNYSFTKTAIVRTPIEEKQTNLTWERILEIFSKKENREALFLGSPNIYKAFVAWERGEMFQEEEDLKNLQGSLYKYASRLSNRSTPFGMFATVAPVTMSGETNLDVKNSELGRVTKYDMYFLGHLVPIFTKNESVKKALKYFSNNSMYRVFDKFRYVEYYFKDNVRFHKISEVEFTEYLDLVFEKAKNGASISELASVLVCDDISLEDAVSFIDTLIESQFVVSELEFTVTGEDYFEKVLKIFSEERFAFYEAEVIKDLITNLKTKINDLDRNGVNDASLYNDIHELVNEQISNVDITKLFQVDSSRKINEGTLSFKTLKALRPAISALNKLNSNSENPNLKDFKKKFQERYEEYEQPLVKVLDPDIGIGYGKQSGAKAPLVDELAIAPKYATEKQISLDAKKSFLLKKLIHSTANNLKSVDLTDEEINKFEEDETLYPDSFSAFVNIFHEEGKEKINIKSVSGPSANGLIGRFAHLDQRILDLCNEISNVESQLNADAVVAEIVHLPQARTGNILYRNFQREYEIPYLGGSSVPSENQILIDDLYVSVKSGRIVLRSKRLGKEVIPRLSNAHNYSSNALPIYHFLCDLQNQTTMGFGFSWGALQNDFTFLPRLTYKDAVLSRATWNISQTDINAILSNDEKDAVKAAREFQKEREIPNLVYIAQGDNEVLINFENDLSCKVFYYMMKGERFLQLKEFFFEEDTITNTYCNEIVVSAHKNVEKREEKQQVKFVSKEELSGVQESFSIGEKWLYYKFYCGERAGEELLNKGINPIVAELKEKGLIDKWFFIRYYDALGHHIRFRVLLKDLTKFNESIRIIKEHISPFENTKIVWKTQTDSYLRELQRYGYEAIETTESLFYNDSECTLKFADMIEGDLGEKIRWLFALLSMDHLLNDFGIALEDKVKVMNIAKTGFGKEFNRGGKLNKQINENFAKHEYEIDCFLDAGNVEEMYEPLWEILQERSVANQDVVAVLKELDKENKFPAPLYQIILSYVHMVCNRIFLTKHRIHEMVVYDYLYKYYSKKLHMNEAGVEAADTKMELIN
ncbi:lantibiotic dehydratase [Flavobacterium amniphilum]|uniref:lantibiotic dehydratase n=1 Tax=Flavobacterium amniphilum TaxID=1834035 RepID=UPI00202A89C0|nr:lantibiotic dehydratase [Flavobacterium amniphilum]MCL9807131.1 lantibiotic dehydratase [Flavobacterium amniphilum]